ncbi:Glycine oxidase [Linum perenne]
MASSLSLLSSTASSPYNRDLVSLQLSFPTLLTGCTESPFFGSKLPAKPLSCSSTPHRLRCPVLHAGPAASASSQPFDVVVIGAGIIGLTIARQLLISSDLSVAIVDKAVPCSGATGAGQGYLWKVHLTPEDETWELVNRSHQLWEMLAESVSDQGLSPVDELGWKRNGSLLVGRTPKESEMLKRKVKQLSKAGVKAQYLSSYELSIEEPDLVVGEDGGAAFLPDDCQLDAYRTVSYIQKANREFSSEGRYAEFYHEQVTGLLSSSGSGEVDGVQTSSGTLISKKAIIVAAGSWTGSLTHELFRDSDITLNIPIKPRKGHLLVLENFNNLKLNRGTMEVGYVDHHDAAAKRGKSDLEPLDLHQSLFVAMGATTDAMGNLVLGSSRQFAGFNTELEESVINRIWSRAGEFFPKLKEKSLRDLTADRKVRIGLRPYMPDGKPVIGPLPTMSNIFIAAGHEGGGLSMALGTAELIADMVTGKPGIVDSAKFSVQGRC